MQVTKVGDRVEKNGSIGSVVELDVRTNRARVFWNHDKFNRPANRHTWCSVSSLRVISAQDVIIERTKENPYAVELGVPGCAWYWRVVTFDGDTFAEGDGDDSYKSAFAKAFNSLSEYEQMQVG